MLSESFGMRQQLDGGHIILRGFELEKLLEAERRQKTRRPMAKENATEQSSNLKFGAVLAKHAIVRACW